MTTPKTTAEECLPTPTPTETPTVTSRLTTDGTRYLPETFESTDGTRALPWPMVDPMGVRRKFQTDYPIGDPRRTPGD